MRFGLEIKALRASQGWTQEDLARRCPMGRGQIVKIERTAERPEDVDAQQLVLLAHGFNMRADDLLAWYRAKPSAIVPQQKPDLADAAGIPILSECPAGHGDLDPTRLGLDNGLGASYIPRVALPHISDPQAYALIVSGDSMSPRYRDGMVVICSPQAAHEPDQVYAIRFGSELNDECTLKRVTPLDNNQLLIQPDNPSHKPRIVPREWIVRMDRVVAKLGVAD